MKSKKSVKKKLKGKRKGKYDEVQEDDPVKKMKSEYSLNANRKESLRHSEFEEDFEQKEDPILLKEKKAMRHLIHDKRARFDFKTTDILKSMLCCRYF